MKSLQQLLEETRVLDLGPLPAPRLDPASTVRQALQMLVRGRRGAVVAVEQGRPVGILTERDTLMKPIEGLFGGRDPAGALADVMSRPPETIRRQASLADAIRMMIDRRFRHLVVVDRDGLLEGLLTTNDLAQLVTDQFPEETVNLPPRLRQRYHTPEGA